VGALRKAGDGKLLPNYRKPFDLISEAVQMQEAEEAKTGAKFDKTAQNEIWLPGLDSNQEPPG
jgi:hypothetical protein